MKHVLRLFRPLSVLVIALSITGCQILDPAEEIPSYVRINSISLTTGGNEGTSSHKITDAWIYIDGDLIGGFEMPCNVPILAEGTHTILVLAGIKQNGLSSTRAIYPFYRGWSSTITLTRGQSITVAPTVTYYPSTNFMWMCDFDQPGTNIDDSQAGGATWGGLLHEDTLGAFEGESGFAKLNADTNLFFARSSNPYSFNNARDVYLELNYKCNQNFAVGIYNTVTAEYVPWVDVSASLAWNKIYIRLNDAILTQQPNGIYHVYVAMKKSADVANPYIYLDNFKLIN